MDIVLNGELHTTRANLSLAALLDELGLAGKRLAVEVNRDIVPRSEYATRVLCPGDRVEIIHAIGGG